MSRAGAAVEDSLPDSSSCQSRWKRIVLEEGISAWTRDGFLVFLNRNHGHAPPEPGAGQRDRAGHYWWFEVFGTDGDLLGEAPTLLRAKQLARGPRD